MRTKDKTKRTDIVKLLGYAAAALSVVSFLTTLNGMKGIVTNDVALATLISFGIQSIILVVGLFFIDAIKKIWNQRLNKIFKVLIAILMILAYLCSVAFSSFFSFVYLSNEAYSEVNTIDYNTELELFLVENTKEIKNINESASAVLLNEIREVSPKFRSLEQGYANSSGQEWNIIVSSRSKYLVSSIPNNERFDAQAAVTAFNGANARNADQQMVDDCNRLAKDVNQFIDRYKTILYPNYEKFFVELTTNNNLSDIDLKRADLKNYISNVQNQIAALNKMVYQPYGSINSYLRQRCNAIVIYYDDLVRELNNLYSTYDELKNNDIVNRGEMVGLENFYKSIYSPDVLSDADFNNASTELKELISAYITDSDNIDDNMIKHLSQCVEYLSMLAQCKNVKEAIKNFEDNNLSITYIINENNGSAENRIMEVNQETWNKSRHRDVSEFISIIKSLPDVDYIISSVDIQSDDSNARYLSEKSADSYITDTLEKAYEYSRDKLEKISNMERAWNYFASDNSFLAIFCMLIAVFLDVASFLIGLYMYACKERKDDNTDNSAHENDKKDAKESTISD